MTTRALLHEVDATLALRRDVFFGMKTRLSGRSSGLVEKARPFEGRDFSGTSLGSAFGATPQALHAACHKDLLDL